MALKTAGAKLLLKGGLLKRSLYVSARRDEANEFAAAAQNGYPNYARAAMAYVAADGITKWAFTNATGIAQNAAAVEFPQPSATSTHAPTHWGLHTAQGLNAGTLLATAQLTGVGTADAPLAPAQSQPFGFDAGMLGLDRDTAGTNRITAAGMIRAYRTGLVSGNTRVAMYDRDPDAQGAVRLVVSTVLNAAAWGFQTNMEENVQNAGLISYGVQAGDLARPTWAALLDGASDTILWKDQLDSNHEDPRAGATIRVAAMGITIGLDVDD